nr:hypothetical protein [uncultured Sphaerochaeta sp.]
MTKSLQDIVKYHGDRLFNGAIDLDWFLHNSVKAAEVAEAYIFHGKQYHDLNYLDKSVVAGKHLTDSISMVKEVINSITNIDNEFMLAIAGYGAGKSHFALMLANLLGSNNLETKNTIIEHIRQIDEAEAQQIKDVLAKDNRPTLVIPINGMRNCNLQQEFFMISKKILERDKQSLECLNKFDARFENLKIKVRDHKNQDKMLKILQAVGLDGFESFEKKMDSFDRICYQSVKSELENNKEKVFEPQAEGELKDLIYSIAESHCGENKYYQSMLILFDEFGKYMAFAASAEQRAGSGIMQQLYEGIQSVNNSSFADGNSRHCSFIGFSQLDLNEYQQSTSMDLNTSNNMKRYVTRFEGARKFYLSVSFESLVANLIEIKDEHPLDIQNEDHLNEIKIYQAIISDFFQSSKQYPIWSDLKRFMQTVVLGCWPLSPLATWTLSYVSSINTVLQQRSALNILGNAFIAHGQDKIHGKMPTSIHAVDLYDVGLGTEFCFSERAIADSYQFALKQEGVLEKYGAQLSPEAKKVLKAIVLSLKLGSFSKSRESAITLLSALSGLDSSVTKRILSELEEEYNVVEYDSRTKLFEIKANAPSVLDFEKILDKKVLELKKDGTEYSQLRNVQTMLLSLLSEYPNIFPDIETSFSAKHKISSLEWNYKAIIKVSIDYEKDLEEDEFIKINGYESRFYGSRGRLFYFIIPRMHDADNARDRIYKWIIDYHKKNGWPVPIMCLIVHDEDGIIFETAEKITVIDSLSNNEKLSYGNLIAKQRDKLIKTFIEELTKQKTRQYYVSIAQNQSSLKKIGDELFEKAYPQVVPFPIDGFTSSAGNGPNTIKKLLISLSLGDFTWRDIVENCTTVDKNRALSLLQNTWGVVGSDGRFLTLPSCIELASLYDVYEESYEEEKLLNFSEMMEIAEKAPYGMNASAVSLVVFIYFAAYALERGIQVDGMQKKLSDFLLQNEKNLFDTKQKGLKKALASRIEMFPIIRDDERWLTLIGKWMNCTSASELIRFDDEAQKLIEQKVKLPDEINRQYHENVNRSATAKQFYKDWKENCEVLLKDVQVFTAEHQPIVKLIHTLNNFIEVYKKFMNTHEDLWSVKDKETIENIIDSAKVHISENIVGWVEAHPFPNDMDAELFNKRVGGYTSLIQAFQSIGINENKEVLVDTLSQGKSTYMHVKEYYKTLRAAKSKLDEEKARYEKIEFMTVHNLEQSIKELILEQNELIEFDAHHGDSLTLNMSRIIDFYKETIEVFAKQLAQRKAEFNGLFDVTISNIEQLEEVERKVRGLMAFYVQDKNEDALHDMLKEINLLRESYNKFSDYNITLEQIKQNLDEDKANIYTQLEGDECFNDEEILDSFFSEIVQKRYIQSKQWFSNLEKEATQIDSVSDANMVMTRINALPIYLADEHKEKVKIIEQRIKSFLAEQKVEFILSLYRELTEEQKKVLLKQLVTERKLELNTN